jgi:hypothetical protein
VRDLGGQLGLEAEAVGADRDALQDVGAERLVARLHVGQVQVRAHVGDERQDAVPDHVPEEQHAARATDEARAEHHIGMAVEDGLDELGVVGRVVLQVRVLDEGDVAGHARDAGAHGRTFTAVLRLQDHLEAVLRRVRRGAPDLVEDLARAVGRAVVDHHDLLADRHGHDALEQRPHRAYLVVDRDDDGQRELRPHDARIVAIPGDPLKLAPRTDARAPALYPAPVFG